MHDELHGLSSHSFGHVALLRHPPAHLPHSYERCYRPRRKLTTCHPPCVLALVMAIACKNTIVTPCTRTSGHKNTIVTSCTRTSGHMHTYVWPHANATFNKSTTNLGRTRRQACRHLTHLLPLLPPSHPRTHSPPCAAHRLRECYDTSLLARVSFAAVQLASSVVVVQSHHPTCVS